MDVTAWSVAFRNLALGVFLIGVAGWVILRLGRAARARTVASAALAPRILNTIQQAVFWKDRDSVYEGCNLVVDDEETFRELRQLDPEVRVILASGDNEQDATSRFVGKGLAGFIQKPFTLRDLEARVREALGS